MLCKVKELASETSLIETSMKTKMTTTTQFIPNEIVDQIILRLPANSLLRLRWACKYWFNLISGDPEFLKKHFHHSTNIFNNDVCVLMRDYNGNLYKRFFNGTTYKASPKVRLDFPFECSRNGFTMLSSCNGLIFFSHSTSILDKIQLCIWNPFTKEYRVLCKPIKTIRNVTYGFGYDHTVDDYKVIINAYSEDRDETHILVYTLRTNSWRRIGLVPKTICPANLYLRNNGVFVNGAIYWIISGKLIYFDIEKEKYQEAPTEIIFADCLKLGVFEGSLCLLTNGIRSRIRDQMWVMNKKTYSWSKVCKMPKLQVMKPLRLNKNGDILLVGGSPSDLLLFNSKKNEEAMKLYIYQGQELCSVKGVYIESLVSLNSGIYASEGNKEASTKRGMEMYASASVV